ncbi:exopolyphosphatase [Ahniella affigens]|uniref:Exopolyphosphatase n=1 Tax=Ahniella affigens TaxID=2021234 RepID=A0A2P1PNF0_9GAMM|nr:exopolyphosphatase [Ahniella affigens]AVP96357.1 exopolyphosphatase [Ahniella affigens]
MNDKKKYRLVTRSDFDGLVCAVLLKELDLIDEIDFVHPKDMQDQRIPITGRDIITNLPYVEGCHLAFDHHLSETSRLDTRRANHIIDPHSPSAARIVYNHFGGKAAFPRVSETMMDEVDRADSAQYNIDEILDAKGWVLLNFLMDARTGLGRFKNFRVSNYQLMMQLIEYCRDHSIEQILSLPDVLERSELYAHHRPLAEAQIKRCANVHGNLVVLDLRDEDIIFATNRFLIYALFPQCNISMHVMWGVKQSNTVFAIGKSITDRSSKTNVGELCLKYRGGGHAAAGTCQVANDDADQIKVDLIAAITAEG